MVRKGKTPGTVFLTLAHQSCLTSQCDSPVRTLTSAGNGFPGHGAPTGDVLSIHTQIMDVKLFAKYALRNNMGVRFNYIYNRFTTNDYTWNNWVYSDGTRVTQDPNQVVNFFGLAFYYSWQ